MNATQTGEILKLLSRAYPTQRQRMTGDEVLGILEVWSAALADVDEAAAHAAAARIVLSSKWFPSIAEFRTAILDNETGPEGVGLAAWGEVRKAIGRWGGNRTPGVDFQFADPVTAQLVSPELWREICQSENTAADRARFVDAYAKVSTTARIAQQLAPGSGGRPALPAARGPISIGSATRLALAAITPTEEG